MHSIALQTIKDITLILHAFDLGGCTSDAPLDEYAHEAVSIFHRYVDGDASSDDHERLERLAMIIYTEMLDSFGLLIIRDLNVYRRIARAIQGIYYANIEMFSSRKRH